MSAGIGKQPTSVIPDFPLFDNYLLKCRLQPHMMAHYSNFSVAETENARLGSIAVPGQPWMYSEILPQK